MKLTLLVFTAFWLVISAEVESQSFIFWCWSACCAATVIIGKWK